MTVRTLISRCLYVAGGSFVTPPSGGLAPTAARREARDSDGWRSRLVHLRPACPGRRLVDGRRERTLDLKLKCTAKPLPEKASQPGINITHPQGQPALGQAERRFPG
jgi:hypothetical protein